MIYIVTACSRPENLEIISKTIPKDCKWVIVHDDKTHIPDMKNAILLQCPDTGIVGTSAQNYALDNLSLLDEDFVLLHDDDNIIHPLWYSNIKPYLDQDFSIMTWGQLLKDGQIRLTPTNIPKVCHIDTASFMIKWSYNKNLRHQTVYEHDGLYAEECAKNGPVLCINKYLSFYNYLR